VGTSGRGAANNKRRYPCDNCGSMEHWKYEVVCPKYHLHLEQLAAKHAGARGQQAGASGGQQGAHLALPPPPPGKNLALCRSSITTVNNITLYDGRILTV
jgi:hypothetical protein